MSRSRSPNITMFSLLHIQGYMIFFLHSGQENNCYYSLPQLYPKERGMARQGKQMPGKKQSFDVVRDRGTGLLADNHIPR